jgi:hypothetical protein
VEHLHAAAVAPFQRGLAALLLLLLALVVVAGLGAAAWRCSAAVAAMGRYVSSSKVARRLAAAWRATSSAFSSRLSGFQNLVSIGLYASGNSDSLRLVRPKMLVLLRETLPSPDQ